MTKGIKKVLRNGKWEEGPATPWQPPEQLRGLPSTWVTKDTSDPDRIHELDDPHIVQALIHEQAKKEQEPPTTPQVKLPWEEKFDQWHIDFLRFKTLSNLVNTYMVMLERGEPVSLKKLHHLWFPKEALDPVFLREGKPPLRYDRPQHLKDKELVIDLYNWPGRIVDMLKAQGVSVPNVGALEAQINQAPRTIQ